MIFLNFKRLLLAFEKNSKNFNVKLLLGIFNLTCNDKCYIIITIMH